MFSFHLVFYESNIYASKWLKKYKCMLNRSPHAMNQTAIQCGGHHPPPPPHTHTPLSKVGIHGIVLSFDTPYYTELPPYSPNTEIENWVNTCHSRDCSLMFTVHYSLFGPKCELLSVYNSLFTVYNSLFGPNSEL